MTNLEPTQATLTEEELVRNMVSNEVTDTDDIPTQIPLSLEDIEKAGEC